MAIALTLAEYLSRKNIPFKTVAHPKSASSKETAHAAYVPDDHLAKGVVVKDEKGYLLVVIPASEWVNLPRLREVLNRDLQLAPENEVEKLFADCRPGAVPPLGQAYEIETIVDEAFNSLSKVFFEAGDHEQLIVVNNAEFLTLIKGSRHGHYCQMD